MDKARMLHEQTGHATYEKIESDFGYVLEDGVLEAYKLVVNGCVPQDAATRHSRIQVFERLLDEEPDLVSKRETKTHHRPSCILKLL